MNARSRRAAAVVLLASALVSACGLKPEVKDQLTQSGGLAAGGGGGAVDANADGTLDPVGTDAAAGGGGTVDPGTGSTGTGTAGGTTGTGPAGGTAGGPAGGTAGGGTAGGSTGGTAGGGTAGGGGADGVPVQGQGNTTGIDFKAKTVTIVLHGPLTGAGVPQQSFETGGPKYWEKSGPNGGPRLLPGGFRVIAKAVDDKYNAQDALRACNAAANEAFLIIGGAGTDQIQACAQSPVLARGNVPYLSSGVTEKMGQPKNYFATSLTYKQQSPLVLSAARDFGYAKGKWAIVITSTPNFADARESMAAQLTSGAAKSAGVVFDPGKDVILTDKAPNNCVDVGTKLRSGGYNTVYFLGQPLFFGQCVQQYPQAVYTGPGPSFGIQSVGDLACRGATAGGGAYKGFYLHPAPDKGTAQGKAAGAPPFSDDIEAGIWGGMQQLEQAFASVKGPLNRENFIASVAKSSAPGGVNLPVVFNGQTRFGGTGAYLNQLTCSGDKAVIKTVATYDKSGARK